MSGLSKVLYYAKEHRSKLYLSILLITLSVIAEIIPYILAFWLINSLIANSATVGFAVAVALGIGAALLCKSWFYGKGLSASHQVAYDSLMGMRIAFAAKLIKQPMGVIQDKGTGSYKKNLVDDIESVEVFLAHMLPEGLPYLMTPIVVLATLSVADWRLALLSLGSIPFGLVVIILMMRSGLKKMRPYYESEEAMNKTIVEFIAGMEVIKIFNQTTRSFEKYVRNIKQYQDFALDWFRTSWTYMAIYTAVLPCTILFLLPVGLHFYLSGTLELGTFIFSLLLAMSMSIPLVKLMEFMPVIPNLSYKIAELEKVFEGNEVFYSGKDRIPKHHKVSYQDVCFAYGEAEVIKGVSFSAEENTVTAIVGESGSGKSTLARLLVKFWDLSQGQITIGDVNINDMPGDVLMNRVSYVEQDTFLFNIPLIENIRIGRPTAGDEEVIEAAKTARCHEFISSLKDGYYSRPGDFGDKLSGGEKQRIAIARSILKDAPIVVLDEATASTDPENEDLIQEALNNLIAGKTLIVIAHRLSTIVEADNIILLDDGRIQASGKHNELLKTSAGYRTLWEAHQASMDWEIISSREVSNA